MELIITIRKEVIDQSHAQTTYDNAVEKLAQIPDLHITGQISNHFQEVHPNEN